ncbi:MAG: hypothetical protein ABR927_10500 [Bacteroidales bacterium]
MKTYRLFVLILTALFGPLASCAGIKSPYSPAGDSLNISVFHSVNIKFPGYNETRVFYSPKHHSTLLSDYKPDLRTTLFWEPNIKMRNNKDLFLNYYNTDNPSKVKVIVEGITTNGIPITGETEYEVR